MEAIILAVLTAATQIAKLVELWKRAAKDQLTDAEIALEIDAILSWKADTNATEDKAHQDALAARAKAIADSASAAALAAGLTPPK